MVSTSKYPKKVAMISLLVADPIKAFTYYIEILGFEKYMYRPENLLAIVKSPLNPDGVTILLEPSEGIYIEIARKFKSKTYEMGMPVISFSSPQIERTVSELKEKGLQFKKDLTKTDYGYDAIFDDDNGNYIQLLHFDEVA